MADNPVQIDLATGDPYLFDMHAIMVHIPIMYELIETDQ